MAQHVLIIAEAGVNHNGSLEIAKKLVDKAVEAGVDIIKFQTFKAEKLVSKSAKQADYQKKNNSNNADDSQYNMLKKLELSKQDHQELVDYCKKKGIQFWSTAFDPDSIEYLHTLNLRVLEGRSRGALVGLILIVVGIVMYFATSNYKAEI